MFSVLSCYGKDAAKWQNLIDRLPLTHRDIMFTPAYARVQEALDQGSCYAAVYEHEEHYILQPFVRQGRTLNTFYGGGGPLFNHMGKWLVSPGPQLWLWFEKEFAAWRRQNRIEKEYVRLHPLFEKAQRDVLRESKLEIKETREAVAVNIDKNDEDLLHSFSRNRIRGIKDALETHIHIEPAKNDAAFAKLYHDSLVRLGAKDHWFYPPAIWSAYRSLLTDDRCTFLMASAGSGDLWPQLLVLHAYGKAYAHFLASDPALAPGINDLLYYESMKYCRDIGCKTYFLGGGTTSDPADNLLAYKSGFSKDRTKVFYYQREFEYLNADSPAQLPA